MRFITMGPEEFPTLLFIHGLSATAESCYGKVGRCLQNQWHIVLCELDGHYDESQTMTDRVFPNMGHCQFLHEHPQEYAALLDQTMRIH